LLLHGWPPIVLQVDLVALLLGIGALNRPVLTPRLARRAEAAPQLRRTIGADLAIAAGVVALTAGLGTVPPPSALAEGPADAPASTHYAVHAAARGHNLALMATPAAVGPNRIDLYLTDGQGRPVSAQAAESAFALPEMGIEPLRAAAAAVETGHFAARINLPLAGEWRVRADLLVDDFTKLSFQARIVVRGTGEAH
jgi:copper transport protein